MPRRPELVSAALGHASGELTWRRYAHLFDAARHAAPLSMVEAIEAVRTELTGSGLHEGCTDEPRTETPRAARRAKN